MVRMTFKSLTTATFATALAIGALSWSAPAGAEDEHEHRINACVDGKRHHIQEQEDRHEISHEQADRMRDHSRDECVREIDGPHH
jgi:hypothetical protein